MFGPLSLVSLIAVFLIEQVRPLDYRLVVARPVEAWADFVESHFNAGSHRHGVVAWCLAVLAPALLAALLHFGLYSLSPLLALAFNIGVLYLTLGFRQFSHFPTEIQVALRVEDLPRARQLLKEWLGRPADHLGEREIASLAIEAALAASHRHVFAVLLCFVLLPGPSGAVLYRLAAIVRERWRGKGVAVDSEFSAFSGRAFGIIDWLPSRATAAGFAIVGDFEDAVHCWRTQPGQWPGRDEGVVIASGAGALGVQLGLSPADGVEAADRGQFGLGDAADVDFMQSAVGLVWRATVLWVLLLFLLGLASLAG